MGSGGVGFSITVVIFASYLLTCTVISRELQRRAVCSDSEVFLDCGSRSVVAIHSAYFSTNVTGENVTCPDSSEAEVEDVCTGDIRVSVNSRCSGLPNCSYNYEEEYLDKECGSHGALVITYDCIRESSANRYCNVQLKAPEGYIMPPGYPRFYPKLRSCNWTLVAGSGQVIVVKLLDIDMQLPRPHLFEPNQFVCDDSLTVFDGNNKLLRSCGHTLEALQTVESATDVMVIQFLSEGFTPARGFLIYYKYQGCPTQPAPQMGYLVYRNGSEALYMCCKDHLFNDTFENSRRLYCLWNRQWNASLSSCVAVEEIKQSTNFSSLDFQIENITSEEIVEEVLKAKDTYTEDILIPSLLMIALVLGNAIIVIIILRIRRKQKTVEEGDIIQSASSCSISAAHGTNV